jgi:hypothetical protein
MDCRRKVFSHSLPGICRSATLHWLPGVFACLYGLYQARLQVLVNKCAARLKHGPEVSVASDRSQPGKWSSQAMGADLFPSAGRKSPGVLVNFERCGASAKKSVLLRICRENVAKIDRVCYFRQKHWCVTRVFALRRRTVQEQRHLTGFCVYAGRVWPPQCIQSITYGGIVMSAAAISTLEEGPADNPVL